MNLIGGLVAWILVMGIMSTIEVFSIFVAIEWLKFPRNVFFGNHMGFEVLNRGLMASGEFSNGLLYMSALFSILLGMLIIRLRKSSLSSFQFIICYAIIYAAGFALISALNIAANVHDSDVTHVVSRTVASLYAPISAFCAATRGRSMILKGA